MNTAASQEYLKNAVMTATPEQLHLMLCDGAIRFALKGREAIDAGKIEETYNHLTRAQKIVVEMQNGLNFDVNRELCERMSALYTFIYRKLVDANINKDVSAVDEALKILHHQRETWVLLMEKIQKEAPTPTSSPSAGAYREPQSPPTPVSPSRATSSDPQRPQEPSFNVEG